LSRRNSRCAEPVESGSLTKLLLVKVEVRIPPSSTVDLAKYDIFEFL